MESLGRNNILKLMKDMKAGHIVFIPRIPDDDHFSVAMINRGGYHFQMFNGYLGHGHVIEVDKDRIKVFKYGSTSNIERITFMPYRKAVDEIKSHHLIYPKIREFIEHHHL
jgi:sulfate adenylyltransferase subunit 1 (EFTu-like GTPase family)